MSKPTKAVMLLYLEDLLRDVDWNDKDVDKDIYQAIRSLIENSDKKVSREFVDELFCKHANEHMEKNLGGFPNDLFVTLNHKQFYNLLKEVGMEVVGE